MFHTRPARYGLAFLGLWCVQLVLVLLLDLGFWTLPYAAIPYWSGALTATTLGLGVLLWRLLPRALRWRQRRHARPSRELTTERQRIARDLHDRVGSQLALAMAQLDPHAPAQAAVLQSLETCLLDLRLVVDSMDGDDDSLADSLARLRHRIQPAMDRRGIRVHWSVCPVAAARLPGGAKARQLAPIVQEALSNVLQHSQATEVTVRLEMSPPQGVWFLEIGDNGRGLPAAPEPARGMGIAGMRRRAAAAGGHLQLLRPGTGGTCIRMQFPLA